MMTHQVLNNKGETVKVFRHNGTQISWQNAKKKAEKLRVKLKDKHNEHFTVMLDCKSSQPWHKKAVTKY